MTIREHLRRLLPVINRKLNTGRNDICFALVVWQKGGDGPLFSAGNDEDPELVSAMLEEAAAIQLAAAPDADELADTRAGHA